MKCDIADLLDNALLERQNVMIHGLPGTGKTSIVLQWLRDHQDVIHGVYLYGSLLNMRPLSGTTRRFNSLTLRGQLFTREELESFRIPDTVIIVDNFQTCDQTVKQHICLLADKCAVDESDADGLILINGIAFVCLIKTITV